MERTHFRTHYDLAELPYFELRDGRLVLADPELRGMIDVHTHLALTYGRRSNVDLERRTAETRHYLPMESAIDLEVYMNKNFSTAQLAALKKDLTFGSFRGGGMRATHTAPNLTAEMDDLGVICSALLPIDFPILSWNAETYIDLAKRHDDLISLGSVHPLAPNLAARLRRQKAAGARGVKVHPSVQMIRPNHPRAMKLYRLCGELDLPVLFHCGPVGIEPAAGRRRCQLSLYGPAVAENPGTRFVLGHSGALQMEQALALCKDYPNVYLELSSQSLANVRRILAEAPADRVMSGSDWPFYHQASVLSKILIATEGQAATRRRVLWENAARLFGIDADKLRAAAAPRRAS